MSTTEEPYPFKTALRQSRAVSTFQEKMLLKVYSPSYDKWLRSFGLLCTWEIEPKARWRYIWHGYRPMYSSMQYCLKSIFYPCNESLNVWTHLIAFLIILWRGIRMYTLLDDPFDSRYAPFFAQCYSGCMVFLVSSSAHAFSGLSPTFQESCYFADYGGIALCYAASIISTQYYICPFHCYGLSHGMSHLTINIVVCSIMFFSHHTACASLRDETSELRRHIKRDLTCYLSYAFFEFPCILRTIYGTIYADDNQQPCDISHSMCKLGEQDFLYLAYIHLACFVGAALSFMSRLPEKLYPGKFDIVGNSHQIFHILIATALISYSVMLEQAIHHLDVLIEYEMVEPSEYRISDNLEVYLPILLLTLGIAFTTYRYSESELSVETKTIKSS